MELLSKTQVGSIWDESGFQEDVEGEETGEGDKSLLESMDLNALAVWFNGFVCITPACPVTRYKSYRPFWPSSLSMV